MKIYTKTGDTGTTSLSGGKRVNKDDMRVDSYGTIDELNSFVGFAAVSNSDDNIARLLLHIQEDLFVLGADLATPLDTPNVNAVRIGDDHIAWIENSIDALETKLTPLEIFILPGGNETAARLHLCRAICRRAERRVVELSAIEKINIDVVRYLNRLSDFFFILSRFANHLAGIEESRWTKR